MKSDCELCELVTGGRVTQLYAESEKVVIVECKTCKCPMYVWKVHTPQPCKMCIEAMVQDAKQRFPARQLDFNMRTIQGHYHFHVR
jgi:hypothetical protein